MAMNYFERLIRRALLQPAKQPGAALADPFENVAEWALDPPARTPPLPPAAAEARTERDHPEAVTTSRVLKKPERAAPVSMERIVQPPAAARREEGPQAAPGVVREIVREIASPPASAPVALNEAEGADEAPPLEIADRFMRGLGVKVPSSTPPAIGSRPAPSLQPPAPPPPREEFREAPAQVVAPTAEPPRQMPASRPTSTAPETSTPPPPAAARRAEEPARRASPTIETREVIVIERRASRGGDESVPGGGSPRFGLGQL